jgi:alcohol dehydrogenase (cytochrome c)
VAFQFTPHDVRDWDALEMPVLIDALFRGQPRKLLVQANRNGYYYVLDRPTDSSARHAVRQQAQLVQRPQPRGPADPDPRHDPSVQARRPACRRWARPTGRRRLTARIPVTFYFMAQEGCSINFRVSDQPGAGGGTSEVPTKGKSGSSSCALDATTGKKIWSLTATSARCAMARRAVDRRGLVSAGEHKGLLYAVDARTGKPRWHFNTGALITSGPISYSIDGQQFIAIVSGASVLAFALPDSAAK